ncbi:MAG: YceI family protein [Spirochaetaceae bacterium]
MKKLLYAGIILVSVVAIAAVGYRIYLGIRAGDGEITREVQAERSFEMEGRADDEEETDQDTVSDTDETEETTVGTIQYGVTSGDDGDSRAQFLIQERIFGRENMVEGTTRQLDGSFLIDYDDHSVRVGQFEINVRDIRTRSLDVDMSRERWSDGERDVVIRAEILESGRDEFEFSTFDPTGVSGVPSSFDIGDTLNIVLTGDLTIRGVTSEVDFDMELVLESEDMISGTASTEVLWEDFGITIPYVGGNSDIDSVEDSVELRLEFTAVQEERSGI